MRATLLDTQESSNKRWAAQDASLRNAVNSSLYSSRQQAQAEGMRYALELVYQGRQIYISYGRRGITVKVDRARVTDPRTLELLEQDWESAGIKKRISDQGVLYNIPRA